MARLFLDIEGLGVGPAYRSKKSCQVDRCDMTQHGAADFVP